MPRPPSDADREFSVRLKALGLVDATPERIQTLREVGLLPSPTRTYPGGGGSTGRYPSDLVERAAEALDLAREHRHELHVAVATMYARGRYSIGENKLKRALLRVVERYRAELDTAAGNNGQAKHPDEVAIDAGIVLARRLERDPDLGEHRRRIRRSNARPKRAVLETILTGIAHAQLTGEAPPNDAIDEILRITGARDVFGADGDGDPNALPTDLDFGNFRLEDIASSVKQADLAQLELARDGALVQMNAARVMQATIPRLVSAPDRISLLFSPTDETTVFAALVNIAALVNTPDKFEHDIRHMKYTASYYDALDHLVQFLPAEFRPLIFLDNALSHDDLTTGQRQRLEALKPEFIKRHPDHARTLGYT